MTERSFVVSVITQTLVILAAAATVAAAGLVVTKPLWDAPPPPPPVVPSTWVPQRITGTDVVLWRPANWTMRMAEDHEARVCIFEASPTSFVALSVLPKHAGASRLDELVAHVLAPLRDNASFDCGPVRDALIGRQHASSLSASWRQLAGLRPVTWRCEIRWGRIGSIGLVAWMVSDAANWGCLRCWGDQLIGSVTVLPSADER